MLIGVLLFFGIIFVNGCVDEKSKFIGSWQTVDGATTLTFNNDNTATVTGVGPLEIVALNGTFNYSITNQKVTFSSGSLGFTLNYSFPSSNQLVLSNEKGTSVIFNKITAGA